MGQKGFTLIEVLVALLVFSLIFTAASRVGGQYVATFERVRDKTLASWIADNRISELRLQENLPAISETSADQDYGQYRWRVTTAVKVTEDPSIRRVDVAVARYRNPSEDPYPVHSLSAFLGTH